MSKLDAQKPLTRTAPSEPSAADPAALGVGASEVSARKPFPLSYALRQPAQRITFEHRSSVSPQTIRSHV